MTSIPRICMLIDRYLPVVGGAETQAFALSEELTARGYEIQILTRRIKPEFPVKEVIGSNQVYRLSPVGLSHKANVFVMFTAIWHLIRYRRTFDILHVHGIGPLGIAGIFIAKILRKKVLLKVATHGDLHRRDPDGIAPSKFSQLVRNIIFPNRLWKFWLQQAGAIVAISKEIAEEANEIGLQRKINYIPNGVDTNKYKATTQSEKSYLRQRLGLSITGNILVVLGRLVERKRVDIVLSSLPFVLQRFPITYVVCLGTGYLQKDSVEDKLHAKTHSLKIEHNVSFIGEVENPIDYLQSADIFVFPSQKEGLPNALLEAMACGLPSIVCEIGGVTDIADETTSWVVPVGDVGAFSQAIIAALSNPDEAQKRGAAGRRKIESQFSLEAVADAYERLYSQLLSSKR